MEVVMDDHAGAQVPFFGAQRHTGDRSREAHRDRRGNPSVGETESRADRRLNPDRRAGGKGDRRAGDGVEAERLRKYLRPAQVAARLQLPEKKVVQALRDHRIPGAGPRAGSGSPRAPGPRNRERKAVSAPGYISRSELCRLLGISRATSYRLERDGFLPRPVRIGPRTTRWPISELEVFERRLAEDRGGANVHASEATSASRD
jgi:predicted DNA-binding transcriptional regulator AlpA